MKKTLAILFATIITISLVSCSSNSSTQNDNDKTVFASRDKQENKEEVTQKETETAPPIKKYTVSFETNGGTSISSKKIEEGKNLSSVPETTRNGYRFEGWYCDKNLTTPVVFPLQVYSNAKLYAKWLCLEKTISQSSIQVKNWNDRKETSVYVTPNGFDMERLAALNYKMSITISYTVRYQKDYTGLGYWGGNPEYNTMLINSDGIGSAKENIKTYTTASSKTISYSDSVANLKNDKIRWVVSTDNIQNLVIFENIQITYQCYQ